MSDTTVIAGEKTSGGLSGSTLKIIAIITMFIDHLAVVALESKALSMPVYTPDDYVTLFQTNGKYIIPYLTMRLIGRLAFPIFCFLLVEGYFHTRSIKKYILRLSLFAIISEIPFDLATHRQAFYWGYQNVFFTLLLGLTVIALMDFVKNRFRGFLLVFTKTAVIVGGIMTALFLHTDYNAMGILTIVLIYVFKQRNNNTIAMAAATVWLTFMNLLEVTSLLDILLVKFYNGKRGLNLKYIFYIFYPAHLFILYAIFQM